MSWRLYLFSNVMAFSIVCCAEMLGCRILLYDAVMVTRSAFSSTGVGYLVAL